jgi:hypothetical protein
MQTFVYQREAADVLPVDPSIATSNPILAGQLVAILTSNGNIVYAGTASSIPIGIASADQDVDENTLDFFVVLFDIGKAAGRVYLVKVNTAVNKYGELWIDNAGSGNALTTAPGSGPIVIGRAMQAGVALSLVPVVC